MGRDVSAIVLESHARKPAMSAIEILERLPDEYLLERTGRGALAILRELAPALRAAGYGLESDGALSTSALRGRRPLLELQTSAGVFLVRRFSHGGLLRFLTRERFRDPSRPFRELSVAASLSRAGVSTPLVAAARVRSAPAWGWRLEIVTRRIEGAADLSEVLAAARSGEIGRPALRRLARAAGAFVRALHDAGCRHADLTTKNILVERSPLSGEVPRIWILDLDRARIGPDLSQEDRRRNLSRLYRYVSRRERTLGPALARTDWFRFLRGYEEDRPRRKSDVRAVLASHAATLPWHAIGWRLEDLFAGR